jgi:hypothetical protein
MTEQRALVLHDGILHYFGNHLRVGSSALRESDKAEC